MAENKSYIKPICEAIREINEEPPIEFIYLGIKEGSFGYVFGPPKCGKTTFCENVAMSLVCQKEEFLGTPLLKKDHRVLFIHFEEYLRQRNDRNDKQIQFLKPSDELINNLLIVDDNFPRNLSTDKEWEILNNTIKESEANVIFIDSQTRASSGDIERSDIARNVTLRLKQIAFENNVTMIIIHHTPKLYGRILTIDSLAGSHVFAQEADFLIGVNRFNGTRYLKEVASRYKRDDEEKVKTFTINDNYWVVPGKQVNENSLFKQADGRFDDTNLNTVRAIIRNATEINENSIFKSNEILPKAENYMDKSTFQEKLGELRSSGEISKTKKGEYKFNNPPSVT